MPVITRKLPDSTPTRRAALKTAKAKRTSSPIATDVLRATTITALDTKQPVFETKCAAIDVAIVNATTANALKDKTKADLHLHSSHFIMVFNLMVRRGKAQPQDRGYYGLDISSEALPPMDTEAELKQVAENIVTGEANRVAAGGTAMSNPTAAEVGTLLTAWYPLLDAASEKGDLLDAAREQISDHTDEIDQLILRLWDEVESYYNNETIESKRANSREWGVTYESSGKPTDITLTVLTAGGKPAVGLDVKLPQGRVTRTTDAEGKVQMTTTLNGELTIEVITDPVTEAVFTTKINVTEGVPYTGTITLPA